MTFADIHKAGFDTETTSTNPHEARIVTAAVVLGGVGPAPKARTWLINPGVPIPPATTEIHGIDDAKAHADGQDPKVALEEIADHIASNLIEGMPLIAFNLSYDWTVLDAELRRHGLPTMTDRLGDKPPILIDPLVIDRRFNRYRRGGHKLGRVCEVHGITLENWHTADADALAAMLVAEAQFARHPELAVISPSNLYATQQDWHRDWAENHQEFRRRTDPTATVSHDWPLQSPPAPIPHQPTRGDAVEAWLKEQRDAYLDGYGHGSPPPEWHTLDRLLDLYRLHADTSTPLDQHVCEGGNRDDCGDESHPF